MPSLTFSWLDVLKLKKLNPKIFNPNKKNKRNIEPPGIIALALCHNF